MNRRDTISLIVRWLLSGGLLSRAAPAQNVESRSRKGRVNVGDQNKQIVQNFIKVVWEQGSLERLGEFWTENCVNHAASKGPNQGLAALRAYHEQFAAGFADFSETHIAIEQQVAEADRVVTQILTTARHTPTGKRVSLETIRIDRIRDGKIAEHWSVADMAGLMQQLTA